MTEVTVHDFVVVYNYVTDEYCALGRKFANVSQVKEQVSDVHDWDQYTILVQVTDVNNSNEC